MGKALITTGVEPQGGQSMFTSSGVILRLAYWQRARRRPPALSAVLDGC